MYKAEVFDEKTATIRRVIRADEEAAVRELYRQVLFLKYGEVKLTITPINIRINPITIHVDWRKN